MYLNAVGGSRGQKNKLSSDESTIKNEQMLFTELKNLFQRKCGKITIFHRELAQMSQEMKISKICFLQILEIGLAYIWSKNGVSSTLF